MDNDEKTYLAVYYERVVLLNDMMINLHGFRDTVRCVQTNPFGIAIWVIIDICSLTSGW
jgi:hypothetical protein